MIFRRVQTPVGPLTISMVGRWLVWVMAYAGVGKGRRSVRGFTGLERKSKGDRVVIGRVVTVNPDFIKTSSMS